MNVIITNKYSNELESLDIDVIKSLNGEYSVKEIINTFQTFVFQMMILDITAIKDYKDLKNLQNLSVTFDMSKIILFLDSEIDRKYISKLISMGIYNFTKKKEDIKNLINHPNSYKDVADYQDVDDDTSIESTPIMNSNIQGKQVVLGFKNVTEHAGATSLIYMLKKALSKSFEVVGMEIDKMDFEFFGDPRMISTTSMKFNDELPKYSSADIILVDLNNTKDLDACTDIIYLIEPSVIKLNKLTRYNGGILTKITDKKVILNKSMIDSKDIDAFEKESRLNVLYNIPPLDERIDNSSIFIPLFTALGLVKGAFKKKDDDDKKKGFGIFKF